MESQQVPELGSWLLSHTLDPGAGLGTRLDVLLLSFSGILLIFLVLIPIWNLSCFVCLLVSCQI